MRIRFAAHRRAEHASVRPALCTTRIHSRAGSIFQRMRRLQPLRVPDARGQVVTSAELKRLGVQPWRLYAPDLSRPLRGVIAAEGIDPHAFDTRVVAIRAIMDEGHFLSRRTAARVLRIPTRFGSEVLEVGAVHPRKPRRRAQLRGHQVRPRALRSLPVGPLWLPHPADAWGLLAAVCDVEDLVVAGDHLISGPSRHERPVCDAAELAETVERFSSSTGIGRLRAALPLLRTGVESPSESRTRYLIVAAGLPEPQTCCPVPVSGRTLYGDLGYPELRIAIEYEGEYHFTGGAARARRDNERFETMRDAGWRVLKLTALDLRTPQPFLARLARAMHEAQGRLRVR